MWVIGKNGILADISGCAIVMFHGHVYAEKAIGVLPSGAPAVHRIDLGTCVPKGGIAGCNEELERVRGYIANGIRNGSGIVDLRNIE